MTSASYRRPRSTWLVPASAPSPTGCVMRARRQPVRRRRSFRKTQGFGNGALVDANELDGVDLATALHQSDLVRLGMAGNLKEFVLTDKDGIPKKGSDIDYNGQPAGYAQDPTEIQNYVDKHDNQTLFDNLAYKAPPGPTWCGCRGSLWRLPCWVRAFPSPTRVSSCCVQVHGAGQLRLR